jgi:hypothetical protein
MTCHKFANEEGDVLFSDFARCNVANQRRMGKVQELLKSSQKRFNERALGCKSWAHHFDRYKLTGQLVSRPVNREQPTLSNSPDDVEASSDDRANHFRVPLPTFQPYGNYKASKKGGKRHGLESPRSW